MITKKRKEAETPAAAILKPTDNIALNRLTDSDANVRTEYDPKAIEDLANNIATVGLLQSLTVQRVKNGHGSYGVVDGKRRLMALKLLVKKKKLSVDEPIPCMVMDENDDLLAASLSANVQREPMTTADEFDAYHNMILAGATVDHVAFTFGVSANYVQQRLKLAKIAPELVKAHRGGNVSLRTLQALTLTDDQELQLKLFKQYKDNDWQIRKAIQRDGVPATDKRVKFVGLAAYQAAGGLFQADLFATDEGDGILITDVAKLDRLVKEKIDAHIATVKGYAWVEFSPKADYELRGVEFIGKEGGKLAKSHGGAYVFLTHEGKLETKGTYFTKADRKEYDKALLRAGNGGGEEGQPAPDPEPSEPEEEKSMYSAALLEDLTKHKTAILAAELAKNHRVALLVTTAALVKSVFYLASNYQNSIQLRLEHGRKPEDGKAVAEMMKSAEAIADSLPKRADNLIGFLAGLQKSEVMDLLAFCVAQSINSVVPKGLRPGAHFDQANEIGLMLEADASKWFTPDLSIFARMNKTALIQAFRESGALIPPEPEKIKVSDLAATAVERIPATGWVPDPLRIKRTKPPQADDDETDQRLNGLYSNETRETVYDEAETEEETELQEA